MSAQSAYMKNYDRKMNAYAAGLVTSYFSSLLLFCTFGRYQAILTADDCVNFRSNSDMLTSIATDVMHKAAVLLQKSGRFNHTSLGGVVTIVDEDAGVSSGGGTNTFGFYNTAFLNGSDIFPKGLCSSVPAKSGEDRFVTLFHSNPSRSALNIHTY